MAAADTAKLVASLSLDDKGFTKGIDRATKKAGSFGATMGKIGSQAQKGVGSAISNIGKLGLVAGGVLAANVVVGIDNLSKLETAVTSVDGAISQLGLTGQVTGQQVASWANDIEANIGAAFDDKDITAAAATLLRFGKVAPKNLHEALVVMTDLAAKTGDVDSASSLLAKALADPTKAAGKLARAGVVLTKAQQATIKTLVKHNKTAQAQKLILDALAKTTGGAALASQGKYARSISVLKDVVEDAQKALAVGLLPIIEKVAGLLSSKLAEPGTLAAIEDFGKTLASSFEQLLAAAGKIPWDSIADAMQLAGTGARAALDFFVGLPPWVQTAVLTGWGLNKLTGGALTGIVGELGKGLIKGVLGMNAGVVNINAGVVNGVGGGVPGAAPAAAAGGLTAGAVATTAAVGVVLVGGTVVSLNQIATEAGKNNLLAAKGLTQQEIIAQKYYNANKADQDRIFKQLHGIIPPESVFKSGNAKLDGIAANVANGGKLQNVANERLEANNAVARAAKTAASADSRSEKATIDAASAAAKTRQDAIKAAAAATAAAIRNKDLSVVLTNYVSVSTHVSVANDLNAKNNYKSVYRVAT